MKERKKERMKERKKNVRKKKEKKKERKKERKKESKNIVRNKNNLFEDECKKEGVTIFSFFSATADRRAVPFGLPLLAATMCDCPFVYLPTNGCPYGRPPTFFEVCYKRSIVTKEIELIKYTNVWDQAKEVWL